MEALNAIFALLDTMTMFTTLQSLAIHHRISLYMNDLVVFLVPLEHDIWLV
jgi:hypothetical protein